MNVRLGSRSVTACGSPWRLFAIAAVLCGCQGPQKEEHALAAGRVPLAEAQPPAEARAENPPSGAEAQPPKPIESEAQPEAGQIDLGKVDTSDARWFQFHGRADITAVHFGDERNVEEFEENEVIPLSPAIFAELRLRDWFSVVAEVEYDGLEESVEVDQAVFLFKPLEEHLIIRAGRYYFPFGLERKYYSPVQNSLVQRPAAFRKVYPGTYADQGIFFEGKFTHHTDWTLGYEAAVTQGLQGPDPDDLPKDFDDANPSPQPGGRVYFSPRPELTFGVSYLLGNYDKNDKLLLDFFGADLRLHLYELEVRFEYVGGHVDHAPGLGNLFRQGWYLHVEREIEVGLRWLDSITPAFRIDWIDPDDTVTDFLDLTRYSAGVDVHLRERLQVKVEVSWSDERSRDVGNDGVLGQVVYSW